MLNTPMRVTFCINLSSKQQVTVSFMYHPGNDSPEAMALSLENAIAKSSGQEISNWHFQEFLEYIVSSDFSYQ